MKFCKPISSPTGWGGGAVGQGGRGASTPRANGPAPAVGHRLRRMAWPGVSGPEAWELDVDTVGAGWWSSDGGGVEKVKGPWARGAGAGTAGPGRLSGAVPMGLAGHCLHTGHPSNQQMSGGHGAGERSDNAKGEQGGTLGGWLWARGWMGTQTQPGAQGHAWVLGLDDATLSCTRVLVPRGATPPFPRGNSGTCEGQQQPRGTSSPSGRNDRCTVCAHPSVGLKAGALLLGLETLRTPARGRRSPGRQLPRTLSPVHTHGRQGAPHTGSKRQSCLQQCAPPSSLCPPQGRAPGRGCNPMARSEWGLSIQKPGSGAGACCRVHLPLSQSLWPSTR